MPRRPLDGPRRVTGDTATHAAYRPTPVGPATDYGADAGEPVFAPFSGWVTHWWSETGGWSVAVTDHVWKVTMQHNSGFRGPSSGEVSEGTNIAVTGSTGSATDGPHVHTWVERVNGSGRLSLEDWLRIFAGFRNTAAFGGTVPGPYQTSVAGGDLKLIPEEEEEDMRIAKNKNDTSTASSHFAWGEGRAPEILSNSTVAIYVGAGVKVSEMSRARWLWLLKKEQEVAKARVGSGAVVGDDSRVLAAIARVSEQIANFPAAPSALENGRAARDAIVKS